MIDKHVQAAFRQYERGGGGGSPRGSSGSQGGDTGSQGGRAGEGGSRIKCWSCGGPHKQFECPIVKKDKAAKSRACLKQEVRQKRKETSSKLDVVPIVEGVFGGTYVLNMWWASLLNQILVLDTLDTFANDLRLLVSILTFRTAPPWIARLLVFWTLYRSYQVYEWLHWSGMLHEFNEIMADAHLSYCWMIDVLDLFSHVLLYTLTRRWRSEELMLGPCMVPLQAFDVG